jgi:hypothetical protein
LFFLGVWVGVALKWYKLPKSWPEQIERDMGNTSLFSFFYFHFISFFFCCEIKYSRQSLFCFFFNDVTKFVLK